MYVMLCDEDGNEEEFEIMHYMKHEGHIYIVLADEDYETFNISISENVSHFGTTLLYICY